MSSQLRRAGPARPASAEGQETKLLPYACYACRLAAAEPQLSATIARAECVLIPLALVAALEQQARACCPNECCGLLVGQPARAGRAVVESVHAVQNANQALPSQCYEIDPRQMARLDRLAEQRGQQIIGCYHSHPGERAVPSQTDSARAWPGYLYLIVGLPRNGDLEIRAWAYDEHTALLDERELVVLVGQELELLPCHRS